jgi:hypothetical protein
MRWCTSLCIREKIVNSLKRQALSAAKPDNGSSFPPTDFARSAIRQWKQVFTVVGLPEQTNHLKQKNQAMKNLLLTAIAVAGLATASTAATVPHKTDHTRAGMHLISTSRASDFQDSTKHKGKKDKAKTDKPADKKQHHAKHDGKKATANKPTSN